jgi:hypothetical protein
MLGGDQLLNGTKGKYVREGLCHGLMACWWYSRSSGAGMLVCGEFAGGRYAFPARAARASVEINADLLADCCYGRSGVVGGRNESTSKA